MNRRWFNLTVGLMAGLFLLIPGRAGLLRVLGTLFGEHDLSLVLLAAVICVIGTIATLNVSDRAAGPRRFIWVLLLSVCAGATVWATHFIAMLAYHAGLPVTYAPGLTAWSFIGGAVVMGFGFMVALRGKTQPSRIGGGAIVGLGVVLLHYLGMAGLRMPGHLSYDPTLVFFSVAFSIGFGALALSVAFGPPRAYARVTGVALLIVMIVSLHFTAMGAVHIGHGIATTPAGPGFSRSVLVTAVAIAALSVLLIGMASAMVDARMSQRLAAEAERFRTLADGAFEGLIVHQNGKIIDANAAARLLLGLDEDMVTRTVHELFDPASGDSICERSADERPLEVTLRRADSSAFPAEMCRRRMVLPRGEEGELLAIRDLTARKESEARIAHLALHDPLTDLPNRRFFMELANKALAQSTRTREGFAILAIDIDDFKLVNDMHGHAAGDELLRTVSQRILATLRDADVCTRFGGDEFAILQIAANEPKQTLALAERLIEALRVPVSFDSTEFTFSVSIGVAMFPDDGATVETLLRNSDTAMYRAKADGKATCRFFEKQMDAALVARRTLEKRLRLAVNENLLSVAYQPIVDSTTRKPVAFEALARWTDPDLGTIMPCDFIPVAEETGLIVPIGDFVLRQACHDAVTWPSPLRVAVNLSAVQFKRKGLVESVKAALEDSGLPGARLELEVTETLLLENREEALTQLRQLKEMGVNIAMDDFGTGYSSLSYLQCFPFDKIKIDRAFVSDLPSNVQNASIVRAVAAMGKSLNMLVVAEGVETDLQADMLRGLDCDELQGFLIAMPMSAIDVDAFIVDRAPVRLRAVRSA